MNKEEGKKSLKLYKSRAITNFQNKITKMYKIP